MVRRPDRDRVTGGDPYRTTAGTIVLAAGTGTGARFAGKLASKGTGKEVGIATTAAAEKLGVKAAAKFIGKGMGSLAGPISGRFVEKALAKIAAKGGSKACR